MHIINSVNFTKLQNADIKGHKQFFFKAQTQCIATRSKI